MPDDDALERRFPRRLLLGGGAAAAALAAVEAIRPATAEAAPTTTPWRLGGNPDVTNDGTNWLGPTNAAPLILKTGRANGSPLERMRIATSGRVGIGITGPVARLDVKATDVTAVQGLSSAQSGIGVAGRDTAYAGTGVLGEGGENGKGVSGSATGRNGIGVYATADGDNDTGGAAVQALGGQYAVYASPGANGIGVWGRGGDTAVKATEATTYGVYAQSSAVGVYGTGPTGVYGLGGGVGVGARGTIYGVQAYGVEAGVQGNCTNTFSGVGVYGGTFGGTGVYAYNGTNDGGLGLYCRGTMQVQGTVSKLAGSFRIDHPLDPENRWLSHSFVESPDMMNVYNGNVVLGADGTATVQLPDYFEALNRDFRYQLTCIGGHAPVYVSREVSKGRFSIAGGTKGLKVSWQVTGIRQDDYAKAHPIVVDTPKPSEQKGTRDFVPVGSRASLYVHNPALVQSS